MAFPILLTVGALGVGWVALSRQRAGMVTAPGIAGQYVNPGSPKDPNGGRGGTFTPAGQEMVHGAITGAAITETSHDPGFMDVGQTPKKPVGARYAATVQKFVKATPQFELAIDSHGAQIEPNQGVDPSTNPGNAGAAGALGTVVSGATGGAALPPVYGDALGASDGEDRNRVAPYYAARLQSQLGNATGDVW